MTRIIQHVSLFIGLVVLGSVLLVIPGEEAVHAAAAVDRDFLCGVLDGEGDVVVTDGIVTVVTDGNSSTIVCRADGVDTNGDGTAEVLDFESTGELCTVLGVGLTDDWHDVVSAAGQVTLVCRAHEGSS